MKKPKPTQRPTRMKMEHLLDAGSLKGYAGPASEPTNVEKLLSKILSCVEPKHEFPPLFHTEGAMTGRMTVSKLQSDSPVRARPTLDDLIERLRRAVSRAEGHSNNFGYLANRLGADSPFQDVAGVAEVQPSPDNFLDSAWQLTAALHNFLDQLDRDYEALSQLEGRPPSATPAGSARG